MIIREALHSDGKAVYELICNMEQKELPWEIFQTIFDEILADRHQHILLSLHEETVTGELHWRMEKQLHHCAAIAEIMELAVSETHRCQGTGKALFEEACRSARKAGCIQIEVACNKLRTRAHHFYRTQGMQDFHFKFSLDLLGGGTRENKLGL